MLSLDVRSWPALWGRSLRFGSRGEAVRAQRVLALNAIADDGETISGLVLQIRQATFHVMSGGLPLSPD